MSDPLVLLDKDMPPYRLSFERVGPTEDEEAFFRFVMSEEGWRWTSTRDLSLSDARRLALAILEALPRTCAHCDAGNVAVAGPTGYMWHQYGDRDMDAEPCENPNPAPVEPPAPLCPDCKQPNGGHSGDCPYLTSEKFYEELQAEKAEEVEPPAPEVPQVLPLGHEYQRCIREEPWTCVNQGCHQAVGDCGDPCTRPEPEHTRTAPEVRS